MIREKRSIYYLLRMNSIHLGTNYLWISYESYILPIELISYNNSSLFLGLIAFTGTAIGVFVGLLIGTVSDRYNFGWGRRGPYIVVATVIASISVFLNRALSISLAGMVIGYIIIQTSSNVAVGAYQPLYVDILKKDERGKGTGIGSIFRLAGSAMGYGITGFLINTGYSKYILIFISIALVATGLITSGTIRKSDIIIPQKKNGIIKLFMNMFNLKSGLHDYIYVVIGSFLVLSGVIGLSFLNFIFLNIYCNMPIQPIMYLLQASLS